MSKKLMTVPEYAEYTGTTAQQVRGLIKSGSLRTKKSGSKHYIVVQDEAGTQNVITEEFEKKVDYAINLMESLAKHLGVPIENMESMVG